MDQDITFFPRIDEKKTRARAKRILEDYRHWRHILNDRDGQKLTQELTFMPRGGGKGPSRPVENLAIKNVDAEAMVEAVEAGVSNVLDENYRYILTQKYLADNSKSNLEIAKYLGYERTQYTEHHKMALLAFAETYKHGALLVFQE